MRKIAKPDTNNDAPDYWERVLESHGLGTRQLGLHEDPEPEEDPELISLEDLDSE